MNRDQILSAVDGGSLQADYYGEISALDDPKEIGEFIEFFTETLLRLEDDEVISGTSDALLGGKLNPEFLGDIYLS
jgi:hypothetical protein